MTKGSGILIFFGLFWSGMTLLFDGFTLVPAARQVLAQRFVATEGIIRSSEVTHHEDSEGDTHGVRITYGYNVAGREYVGDRYRYNAGSSSDCGWANQAVANHPVGKTVTVYYNPRNPADALLRPGLAGSDLILVMFMTPFNAVMLGFWWFGWNRLMRRWRNPIAGGVKVTTGLRQTRARLTEYSPLVVTLASIAFAAFLSLFVILISYGGFHPPLHAMKITWLIVIALGVANGLWHWKKILTGDYDLILDELNGAIQLPTTCGRKTRTSFQFAEVHNAFVETIEKRDSEGSTSYTYVPALRLGAIDGPTEKLAEWHDAERAREFVAWLNEKLDPRTPHHRAGPGPENPAQPQADG